MDVEVIKDKVISHQGENVELSCGEMHIVK